MEIAQFFSHPKSIMNSDNLAVLFLKANKKPLRKKR